MSYKVLFFMPFYPDYLDYFYERRNGISIKSYSEQLRAFEADHFGYFYAYVNALNRLGHQAAILIPNCRPLQLQWAREHGVAFDDREWTRAVALEQIRRYQPDIFYIGSVFEYYGDYLGEVKKHARQIVAQMACQLPPDLNLSHIDCIVTSARHFYHDFQKRRLRAEYLESGFDSDVLGSLTRDRTPIELSFVGGLHGGAHSERVRLLRLLSKKTPIKIWGYGLEKGSFFKRNPIEGRYQGRAYGMEMYDILRRSKMTFHCHIDVAGTFAGAQRLYEATGVGTLLITDAKENICEFLEPDKEVVTFSTDDELLEKVRYYATHDREREAIAHAGQQRTLKDHTIQERVKDLLPILKSVLQ